jgi:lipoyl(octanoyl) transferase
LVGPPARITSVAPAGQRFRPPLGVCPNLAHFGGIVPCGIAATEGTVTSMAIELGRPVDGAEVKRVLAAEF